jgi:hypothetical protein
VQELLVELRRTVVPAGDDDKLGSRSRTRERRVQSAALPDPDTAVGITVHDQERRAGRGYVPAQVGPFGLGRAVRGDEAKEPGGGSAGGVGRLHDVLTGVVV